MVVGEDNGVENGICEGRDLFGPPFVEDGDPPFGVGDERGKRRRGKRRTASTVLPPARGAQAAGLKNFGKPVEFSAYVADQRRVSGAFRANGIELGGERGGHATALHRVEEEAHANGVDHYAENRLPLADAGLVGDGEASGS